MGFIMVGDSKSIGQDRDDIIPGEDPKYNTEVKQLAAVRQDATTIRYIKNPTEHVQLAAIRKYGYAIRYIENPSEEVQIFAIQRYGYAISHIKNPSEELQLAAVRFNGRYIYYILEKGIVPSIDVQKAAVLNNPVWALRYMVDYNIPISKMIQWTAAKRLVELGLTSIDYSKLLDTDVQNWIKNQTILSL